MEVEEVEQTQREEQWIRNEILWLLAHLNSTLEWSQEIWKLKGLALELENEIRFNDIDVERIKMRLVETIETLESLQDKTFTMSKIVIEVIRKLL